MIIAYILWNPNTSIGVVMCGVPEGAQIDWESFAENARQCFEETVNF
jgi:hypothetical protein